MSVAPPTEAGQPGATPDGTTPGSEAPANTGQNGAAWTTYRARVETLKAQYAAMPPGAPVRLKKKTSNLFRTREANKTPGLDVAAFDGVIEVDPVARTADVQGMTTYEHLVDATLPYGLMPLVVPELKTITIGGAVTGLGIESSSWRNGMPHESVIEMDLLTGAGDVLTVRPEGEHRDLFFGFPNSYGTLGYALRLKIELEPIRPYVHLRHVRFTSIDELAAALQQVCSAGKWEEEEVAFVDGTVFSRDELYLTLGSWAGHAPFAHDYTRSEIYYRSIQSRTEDYLTIRDYLWRWDTDWFWCSRAFGVQRRWVRQLLGRRFLRSDTYWKVLKLEERYHVKAGIDRRRGLAERENVVQDVEVPVGHLAEFVDGFLREIPISPFWLCPLRQRPIGPGAEASWDLYPLERDELYVNVGFWSTVARQLGMDPAHHNRWVEDEVDRLDGRKSLYSTAFYSEDHFWELYNGPAYHRLKARYDPAGRLLDLYAKCVQSR
jgi:FAD/FMN-containing dehydrogenase